MSPVRAKGLLVTLAITASAAAACTGGDDDPHDPDRLRGGAMIMTLSSVSGFDPETSLTGIGAFFEPPGPAAPPWPEDASCEWTAPLPEETATPEPTPTPAVGWRDAGAAITVRSAANAVALDRFEGPNGEIFYLTAADVEPDAFPPGTTYDVEIAGSGDTNGIAAATLAGGLVAPAPLDLYAPELEPAPASLPRSALQIGWVPGVPSDFVKIQVVVSGSAGSATLACSASDSGFYEIAADSMEQFPSGGGTLTVSRRARRETKLADDTWFDAETVLVEGGAILLP